MRILLLGGEKEKRNSDLHVTVHMPKSLILLLRKLTDELPTEFSIVLYGSISPYPVIGDQDDEVTVTVTDYYIPKQKVSTAYVDIEEYVHPIRNGHKVLGTIHRHPSGITSFSHTDHQHTNTKFPFNLLYVPLSYLYYPYYYVGDYDPKWRSTWDRAKSPFTQVDDLDDASSFTEASIWCIDKGKVLANLYDIERSGGKDLLDVKIVSKNVKEPIIVHADVCYTDKIDVKIYEDLERLTKLDDILSDAMQNIGEYSWPWYESRKRRSKSKKSKQRKSSKNQHYDPFSEDITIDIDENLNDIDW